MVVFPNAKINLGLNIISKREDGYHNISSCFYPIPLADILEIIPSSALSFQHSGLPIPDDDENNLCLKAYQLLSRDFDLPPVSIHLHKIIPIGAGLGGGSSDASFTLKCLNEQFELGRTMEQLRHYASLLGSDCPFFIENTPVLAEGTGTDLENIDIDISEKYLVLLNPGIHVSTATAYSQVTPKQPAQSIGEIVIRPVETWQNNLKNDFETSVFPQYPTIENIKIQLIEAGAVYASMTGSGSSVYGIFHEEIKLPSKLERYVCWKGALTID